jgi:hypothetical protein
MDGSGSGGNNRRKDNNQRAKKTSELHKVPLMK